MNIYTVIIDGTLQDKAYQTIRGVVRAYPAIPYSTLREAFLTNSQRVYLSGEIVYKVNRLELVKIVGRGGNRKGYFIKAKKSA